jgi:hypothetical protein
VACTLLVTTSLATPAHAQARKQATVLMSQSERGREFQEKWGFNDAIVVGDTIYLSGIVVGKAPGQTDMQAAYDRFTSASARS